MISISTSTKTNICQLEIEQEVLLMSNKIVVFINSSNKEGIMLNLLMISIVNQILKTALSIKFQSFRIVIKNNNSNKLQLNKTYSPRVEPII